MRQFDEITAWCLVICFCLMCYGLIEHNWLAAFTGFVGLFGSLAGLAKD